MGPAGGLLRAPDGASQSFARREAHLALADKTIILCSLPLVARRLGFAPDPALDVLELFCFVHPAQPCVPTVAGLAQALGLPAPGPDLPAQAACVARAAARLLDALAQPRYRWRAGARETARRMGAAGWPWAADVLAALGAEGQASPPVFSSLPEWRSEAPPPPPRDVVLDEAVVLERLRQLLGADAEDRDGQRHYALAAAHAFALRQAEGAPNVQLAEAGTGIGKTLGYVAPASLWARQSGGTVWIATYTKALQRQIDRELSRLYPSPAEKSAHVVLRKGRENYLCLLNLEEAMAQAGLPGMANRDTVLLGLIERWTRASRDGDLVGGDFPSWLAAHFGPGRLAALTDHRGECLYSGCRHYRRCFIERSQRAAGQAEIVIANHALVMINAARQRLEAGAPLRYVFDEAHHIFDAADQCFSAHLTGREMADLRRWLLGPEGGGRRRGRGLMTRLGDLAANEKTQSLAEAALMAARALPAADWLARLRQDTPYGPAETLLGLIRRQVLARADQRFSDHGLECDVAAPIDGLIEAAAALDQALAGIARPVDALVRHLQDLLRQEDGAALESEDRGRVEGTARALAYRLEAMVLPWRAMLGRLGGGDEEGFVDWFAIDRAQGREQDIGMHRHLIDPTAPFARLVLTPAHGAVITSATLRDKAPAQDTDAAADLDWRRAEVRAGAQHLALPPRRLAIASPFDYAQQTRLFVVTDVDKRDLGQVAAAYHALFRAAGGGALGLFTAIARLRAVHGRLAEPLFQAGLPLYAQHVDPIDTGSLIDIFRAEENACLLGTDAVRDGIDVPGRSLRLIVFDRLPWPRPSLLHRARRAAFGGRVYDDLIVRLRLTQAFGRLVRRANDHGVFVMLDPAAPSRVFSGLPDGVTIQRIGLAEAVRQINAFLDAPALATNEPRQ
ncbi:MAG: ATP-dependent DNA helicase [Sphingomonadales bacterium]